MQTAPCGGRNEPLNIACNFLWRLRVAIDAPTKDRVVGSGSTDVGNKGPTRNQGKTRRPDRPRLDALAGADPFPELRIDGRGALRTAGVCAAMSEQHGDGGNLSAPQKFVHLVGCRDPNARTEPWVRPRLPAAER